MNIFKKIIFINKYIYFRDNLLKNVLPVKRFSFNELENIFQTCNKLYLSYNIYDTILYNHIASPQLYNIYNTYCIKCNKINDLFVKKP